MSQFGAQPFWKPGDPITAAKLNECNARDIQQIRVGPGLQITRLGPDVSLRVNFPSYKAAIVRAKLTTVPGTGTPYVAGTTPWDGTGLSSVEVFAKLAFPHSLNDNLLIFQPFGGTDQTDPNGEPVTWVEVHMSPNVVVKITSNVSSAGGKYNGTIYSGAMNDAGTGNLAMPDGLTSGQSCLVLNLDEQGQPTHWLTTNVSTSYAQGVYWGMSTEGPPRPIIVIDRGDYRIASPQAIVGSGNTADASTWNRRVETSGTDYGDVPLTITTQRTVWDGTAGILRAFTRTLTFAADGRLDTYSAETESDIDTATACP